ncbi:hypothetical protein [Segeticoccus rhizosphaerae]|uniref:hypothetical protein n=1 Tax=Segeticoccus rhizosphaerae TaxID=1104777 RepID=UPI0012655710|nr:hypothetical protein [Segeticoccus rhizosphaerae]
MTAVPPDWVTLPDEVFRDRYRPAHRLTRGYLHRVLLRALGPAVERLPSDEDLDCQALVVDLAPPLPPRLRFYVYEATQHASERQRGTFKVQLTKGVAGPCTSGRRLHFDRAGNIRPILTGYHPDWHLFILWDADLHDLGGGFAYSKNVQAPPDVVWGAIAHGLAHGDRRLKNPAVTETIVAARPRRLAEALGLRIRLSNRTLCAGVL